MLLLLLGLGCTGADGVSVPEPLSAKEAEARAEALQEPVASGDKRPPVEVVPGAEPAEIVLVWQGIGNLHRSFFSNPDVVAHLSQGFGGRLAGSANVYVRHDNEEFVGSLRLQLRPDTLKIPVQSSAEHIQLQDLSPITQALAAYRSEVAARFDFRVESFSVGIESFRGPHTCIFGVAGPPPPDGRLVSPCVELDGQQVCGEASELGVHFEQDALVKIKRCLDL